MKFTSLGLDGKRLEEYVPGGYARSVAFGTRIYTVIEVHPDRVILRKLGETNRGDFKFTRKRLRFEISRESIDRRSPNWSWYYPVRLKEE
jgi:hypothetical protein